jgi:hypothetical protein
LVVEHLRYGDASLLLVPRQPPWKRLVIRDGGRDLVNRQRWLSVAAFEIEPGMAGRVRGGVIGTTSGGMPNMSIEMPCGSGPKALLIKGERRLVCGPGAIERSHSRGSVRWVCVLKATLCRRDGIKEAREPFCVVLRDRKNFLLAWIHGFAVLFCSEDTAPNGAL